MSDRRKDLQKILNKMKLPEGAVVGFGDEERFGYDLAPTPFPTLNRATGGGLPRGKVICFTGPPGTCKTAMALHCIAHWQSIHEDWTTLWIDAENAFDPAWATSLGVDVSRVIVYQKAKKLEDYLDAAISLVDTGQVDILVIDALGAASPSTEQASKGKTIRTLEDDTMGLQARKYSQFLRVINPRIAASKSIAILIAQVYKNISMYGGMYEIKGGTAFAHYQYLRLMFRRSKDETTRKVRMPDGEMKDLPIGFIIHVKVDKTKQSDTEGYEIVLPFRYGVGIAAAEAAILTAIQLGIVERAGAWYTWGEGRWQGKAAVIKHFMESEEETRRLSEALDEFAEEAAIVASSSIEEDPKLEDPETIL